MESSSLYTVHISRWGVCTFPLARLSWIVDGFAYHAIISNFYAFFGTFAEMRRMPNDRFISNTPQRRVLTLGHYNFFLWADVPRRYSMCWIYLWKLREWKIDSKTPSLQFPRTVQCSRQFRPVWHYIQFTNMFLPMDVGHFEQKLRLVHLEKAT